ncbi:hypothetical protein TeGR_g8438 [Tetraparma gracilis]|uniref:PhoD-like phosphatase metallophosphatase domain-containing protein n=1 Tax=Tetraparma gracilis TaxID=2962635 RepID=A0ABQ6MR53_9STRA|nr:hypothetical protein TeGR_g8438 [Tetraparma gracilis]
MQLPPHLIYIALTSSLLVYALYFHNHVSPQLHTASSFLTLHQVTPTSATFWVRHPEPGPFSVSLTSGSGAELTATESFSPSDDFTGTLLFQDLRPGTEYAFQGPGAGGTFTTREADPNQKLTFVSGSCTMIARTARLRLLGLRSVLAQKPDFLIFLGDLIYADVPRLGGGLGGRLHMYRAMYREVFANADFAALTTNTPTYYMFDDHEIINDYNELPDSDPYEPAVRAWREYAGSTNPALGGGGGGEQRHYYHFTQGSGDFFVLDTRSYRLGKEADSCAATDQGEDVSMLGVEQTQTLKAWLLASTSVFKFVASPQPLSRNVDAHGESCEEAWSGHAWEREELLDWIEGQEGLEGVVFLTGDLHQVGVYALRESIAEISASPFDASGQVSNHAKGGEDVTFFERYLGNYYYNVTNKLALRAAGGTSGFPMTISSLQIGVGALYALFMWAAPNGRSLPKITVDDVVKMLPVAFCAMGSHCA